MSETVLKVEKLIKEYGAYRAVDEISFEIKRGQVLGLLGPNGAGKSTTIQILAGVTLPSGGNVHYFGMDFFKQRQACLQRLNYTSAYNTLQNKMTVKENLLVFAGLYGVKNPVNKITELLEYFQISELYKQMFHSLSAGQKTRVNLVKALINDPELILMDEPTASLDPDIADKVLSLIENLRTDKNMSILFTSHNMAEVARICDEVIFLHKGKIVSHDTPANHTKRFEEVHVILQYRGEQIKLDKLLRNHKVKLDRLSTNEVSFRAKNDAVAVIIASLLQSGIKIVDTDIQKPSLEDVFLEIARAK